MPAPERSLEEMLSELEALAKAASRGPWFSAGTDYPASHDMASVEDSTLSLLGKEQSGGAIIRKKEDHAYIVGSNPAFALELISAVRSALSPKQGEMPELTITEEDKAVAGGWVDAYDRGSPVGHRQALWEIAAMTRQLRAANAQLSEAISRLGQREEEIDRLKGELETIRGIDGKQMGERYERYLNEGLTSKECRVNWFEMNQNKSILLSWWDRLNKAEAALITSHASGKQEGRKECLEAVLLLHKSNHIHQVARDYIHISDAQHAKVLDLAERAILAIGKAGE